MKKESIFDNRTFLMVLSVIMAFFVAFCVDGQQ